MVDLQESVVVEKSRLDSAFHRLEQALGKYARHVEEQVRYNTATELKSEIETTKDEVKTLNDRTQEATAEISHLSAEVVRYKEENRRLKELNDKISGLLKKSIEELEELVS